MLDPVHTRGGGRRNLLAATPPTGAGAAPPPPASATSAAVPPPVADTTPRRGAIAPETDPDTFIVRLQAGGAAAPEFPEVEVELEKRAGGEALNTHVGRARRHPDETLAQAMARVGALPGVLYVEPAFKYRPVAAPNDPGFVEQWGMAKIGMPEAWNLATGSDADNNGLLCVIDTGLDSSHPDLAANVPVAYKAGFNAITNAVGADEVVADAIQHGTHCAGIAAAVGGNGVGVSGVNQRARVIGCKFIDDVTGWGDVVDASECIDWCIAQGATISSNSWVGKGYSQVLYDVIAAANTVGHLVVAAAGNDGTNNDISPTYPASYALPNIISVAATDAADALATWSNYGVSAGPGTDIAAPGVNIISTVPGGGYTVMSGTSMACPHVAGVAALIRSATGGALKNAAQVKDLILATSDPLPGLLRKVGARGGRLSALAALQAALTAVPLPLPPLFNSTAMPVGATLPWTSAPLNLQSGLKVALPQVTVASCPQGAIAPGSAVTFASLFTTGTVKKVARRLVGLPTAGTLTVDNCDMPLRGRWNSVLAVVSCPAGAVSGCQCWADNDGCPGALPGGPDRVAGVTLAPGRDYYVITMATTVAAATGAFTLKVTVPEAAGNLPLRNSTTMAPPAPALVGAPPVGSVAAPPPPAKRSAPPPPLRGR